MSDEETNQDSTTNNEVVETLTLAEVEEREKGLKQSQQSILAEKKALEVELKTLRDAKQSAERKSMEEKEDFKGLFEQTKAESESWKTKHDELLNTVTKNQIESASVRLGAKLAADEGDQELLTEQAAKYMKINEHGKVSFQMGGIEVSEAEVIKTLSDRFPKNVKGTGAGGAGSQGNQDKGGAPVGKAKQEAIQAAKKKGDMSALRKAHNMKD